MDAVGVAVATIAAFILSAVYYGAVPQVESSAPQRPVVAVMVVEIIRNLTISALLAGLLAVANWNGAVTGATLGVSLWALPAVLLVGSVFHEGVQVRTASLHAVDWLIKLTAIGAILGSFA